MRLSYTQNGSGTEIIEENNYYPFGMKHEGYNALAGNPSYNYGYNGKELQKETGWSDYGARMYMSDIARWGVIDPLAETTRRISPYNYAMNNPVMFIDPDGRKAYEPMEWTGETSIRSGYRNYNDGEIPTIFTPDAGGGSPVSSEGNPSESGDGFWRGVGKFFKRIFGSKKKRSNGILTVGTPERLPDGHTRLFGLIKNANVNAYGQSPLEAYRESQSNSLYNEGETSLDRSFRLISSSHIEIMQDFGGGGYNMFGGYGRIGNAVGVAEEVSIVSKISVEAEANGILSTQKGINPVKVAEYLEQMSNGTYKPTGGAGYIHEGKYILTDGNHRMNAAIQHGIETGNFQYVEQLINKGNFIRRNPLMDNYRIYKLPVK